ncbi:MAG: acyltransferase [Sphingobium sp.]
MINPVNAPCVDDPKKIIYSLQILRGIAAVLVLVRHTSKFAWGQDSELAFPAGQAGVDIFFVISGVVIYLTGRNLSWDVFARRRLARIVPLYWAILLVAVAASFLPRLLGASAIPLNGGSESWNVISSFLFIPSFDENHDIYPLIVAGWTLNFEMYFYAICTLVLMFAPRRLFLMLVSVAVMGCIALGAPLFWATDRAVDFPPMILLLPIAGEFVSGMWIAHIWNGGGRTSRGITLSVLVLAIIWLALAPTAQPFTAWRPLAWGVPAVAIVWALLSLEESIRFDRWRAALLVGDASYALYLTHPVVLLLATALMRALHVDLDFGLKLALALAGCLIVGVAVHKLVEKPLVRAANKLLGLSRARSHHVVQAVEASATA